MAKNIDLRIRRGAQSATPALSVGEPGFTTDTKQLLIGDGISNILIGPTPSSAIDHGGVIGLTDDDHPQYHNDTRGDIRYYTKTLLDAGQLDSRYYTETEVKALIATTNRDTLYVIADALSTTTSTSWQTKTTLSTGTILEGVFRIGWYYEWAYTGGGRNFQAQVQLDNTTTIMSHIQEPQDTATTQSIPVSGFYYVALAEGIHTIDLDYRSSNTSETARIKNARLEFWRVQ